MNEIQRYLDVKGVAKRYGVVTSSIYAFVRRGVLRPPVKFGGSSRWSIKKLDEDDARREAGVDSTRAQAANAARRKAQGKVQAGQGKAQ